MKLTVPSWLFFIALAVIIAMIFMWPESKTVNTQPWKDTISRKTDEIKTLQENLVIIREKVTEDSLQSIKAKEEYEVKVSRLRSTVAKLKASPVVVKVLEENFEVYDLVNSQDSVIEVQDNRIMSLETELGKLRVNMVGVTQNFEQQIAAQEERFTASQELSKTLEGDLRREKRRAKIARVLIPVAFVVGLVLGQ